MTRAKQLAQDKGLSPKGTGKKFTILGVRCVVKNRSKITRQIDTLLPQWTEDAVITETPDQTYITLRYDDYTGMLQELQKHIK